MCLWFWNFGNLTLKKFLKWLWKYLKSVCRSPVLGIFCSHLGLTLPPGNSCNAIYLIENTPGSQFLEYIWHLIDQLPTPFYGNIYPILEKGFRKCAHRIYCGGKPLDPNFPALRLHIHPATWDLGGSYNCSTVLIQNSVKIGHFVWRN